MSITLQRIESRAGQDVLTVLGAFHGDAETNLPNGAQTLVLLGPNEPGFWDHVTLSPEFADNAPDPLDRWSSRIISRLAEDLGARALFPFGGPPYQPFIAWALKSGRAWQSPVTLLVHDRAGLMVSYRGALAFDERLDLPAPAPCPCDTCEDKPCLVACPVNALANSAYDLAACHGYLDTRPGQECLTRGCAARRACPVSQSYGRNPAQSAFHMKAFHP